MKCDKCDTVIYLGDPSDSEANIKRISHNEWHHSTQHDNVVRAKGLWDDAESLFRDVVNGDFLEGYVKTDLMMTEIMKIRRFCEDNMQSPVG